MKKFSNYICLFFTIALIPNIILAQKKVSTDNGYYTTYPTDPILRLFFLQKFAPFTISATGSDNDLNYKTNSKLNLGIGATYKSVTLNVSYGFKFLNKDKGRGTTKGLDFQFHLYPQKWAIDILGTFRKGYYLDPKDKNGLNLANYYLRPDLKRNITGISVFRVAHSDRFSYRAAFTQNDVQTKSAGSLLYGGEAFLGTIKGDSAFVPNQVSNSFPQAGVDKINFFSIGPGIGYAYTLVIVKNFFVTASAVGLLNLNISTEQGTNNKNQKVGLIPDGNYKGAIGYNSGSWSLTANITGNTLYTGSKSSSKEYFIPTGNLRLIFAKRIGAKSH